MRLFPNSRRSVLVRFAIGAVIVIGFTATTTAVAGLLQFKQFAVELSATPALSHAHVTIPDPGNPQTLLLIGSDHRAGEPFSASHTDTMMLVRMDPASSTINVLSIPRDLKVQIPVHGIPTDEKLNAAYSIGGPGLLVSVLRQQAFPDLRVNHIIDVNFGGFEALVNAVGCLYVDVDHRYYNDTALTNYSSIDLQPGYQKLCGADALSFVRFRHTDNDIVRNARQQDFLRWAKDQFGSSYLISNRDMLLRIFGQHTQTDQDLHSIDGLINLFNLVAFSAGHAVKQVPFPASLLPCGAPPPRAAPAVLQTPCYVGADPTSEQRAFQQFMTPTPPAAAPARSGGGPGGKGPAPAAKPSDVTADPSDGKAQAAALGPTQLPVYFPGLLATGSSYCSSETCPIGPMANSYPRAYLIHDAEGNAFPSYRMTLVMNSALGQYYGIQGTTWQNAPILAHPTETRTVDGRQLLLYFNGHKLTMAAWRTPQAVYWVSNTLTDDLSNGQLASIAASLTRAGS